VELHVGERVRGKGNQRTNNADILAFGFKASEG
jgi:hypothetical protein